MFFFKILSGKPTGKRPLGSPRRKWEGNIRMNLKEMGVNPRKWVDSTEDRDYWRALEPPGSISHGVTVFCSVVGTSTSSTP